MNIDGIMGAMNDRPATAARAHDASAAGDDRLTLQNLGGFLLGRRESILAAAHDRSTLWVGALFVAAAALARSYDNQDLRRDPWHLMIPFVASMSLAAILFAMVRPRGRPNTSSFQSDYRVFLGLLWLTAPMAMLYGIPYERILWRLTAVKANLWTLALIAAWRVALMTRIVSVITGRYTLASFFLVMLVADAIAAVALMLAPIPTLDLMGGVQLTDAEQLLQGIGLLARVISVATLPIWLVLALIARRMQPLHHPPEIIAREHSLRSAPMVLAAGCVLAWLLVLPATQHEQRLASAAEQMLRRGEIERALAVMSSHQRGDYPPAWDPPPHIGWPEPEQPPVCDVIELIAKQNTAPWVRAIYLDKFERRWLGRGELDEATMARMVTLIDALPEGPALRAKYHYYFEHFPTRRPSTKPETP